MIEMILMIVVIVLGIISILERMRIEELNHYLDIYEVELEQMSQDKQNLKKQIKNIINRYEGDKQNETANLDN